MIDWYGRIEIILKHRNEYYVSDHIVGAKRQEIEEEIIQKEKELGAALRYQRDLEGRIV